MKKFFLFLLSIGCFLGGIGSVLASDDGFTQVKSEAELDSCFISGTTCRLEADVVLSNAKGISKDVILDLNGQSITAPSSLEIKSGLLSVNRGGSLVIMDSKGSGKISTGSNKNIYAAVNLLKDSSDDGLAELVVNGGTLEGYYYGIVGNGTRHNTKITINGGTVKALNTDDSAGIYHPQKGDIIINGGTISGGTGIEMRAGNLTVNAGKIEGVAPKFVKMVNGNGTTTNGVGITVAQHTTKLPIKVNVNGGEISGEYAFYEWNPHKNSKEDLKTVTLNIDGGTFTGYADGVKCVYSEDFTKFIRDGKFNTKVDEYLSDDAKVVAKLEGANRDLNSKKDDGNMSFFLIVGIIVVLGGSLALVYFQKKA